MIPAVLPTYNRAPLSFVSGQGSWLTEADGRRFLDFAAGIAVNSLGHAHPDLVRVLSEQAAQLWHVSNLYTIPAQEALAAQLVDLTFADTVFFTNSGTESCELAVKMARKYWFEKGQSDRVEIVTFSGGFHGRSAAGIAAAGSEKMTHGFAPLLPGFTHLDWGDLGGLKALLTGEQAGRIAAVLLEPVQGEGGIRPIADADLQTIRALCDEAGALLILDEVQCGMGRTGRLFAYEWASVLPDIMMVAKGIGGGFPLGAVLASENAASGMTAGTHGSTYGGNPLGCAVGLEVLRHVSDPAFLDEISRKAGFLRQQLEALVAAHPDVFEDVRGSGLMIGLVCRAPNVDVVNAAYGQELLTVPAADNVVRLLPPLTVSENEISQAVDRLDRAASQVAAQAVA